MSYFIRDAGRKLFEADITNLENVIGIALPRAYRDFLLNHNGGRPTPKIFRIPQTKSFGQVLDFFAIDDPVESCCIDWNVGVFSARMPSGLIPIACEDGGNIICIGVDTQKIGRIYYWDHDNETSAAGYQNVFKIAESLDEFLENLLDLDESSMR